MAGGRVRLVRIVNRTTDVLDCMYDGVPEKVPAGYRLVDTPPPSEGAEPRLEVVGANPDGSVYEHVVEYFAAEAYKRQHPRMGTQDPFSVDARDTEYLIAVPEWGDDISHIEQTDADELIDRTLLPPQRQSAIKVDLGRSDREQPRVLEAPKTKKAAKELRKARTKKRAQAQANRRSRYADSTGGQNPTGLKMQYVQQGEGG